MLQITGYNLETELCKDRTDTAGGIGGGLLVYSRIDIKVRANTNNCTFTQFTDFTVEGRETKDDVRIVLIYRSPNSSPENTGRLGDLFSNKNQKTIILGDFNMPEVNWSTLSGPARYSEFLESPEVCEYKQLVNFSTHIRGNTLDCIFTNFADDIAELKTNGYLGKSDHQIISFSVNNQCKKSNEKRSFHDWSSTGITNLREFLSRVKWSDEMSVRNVEESWEFIRNVCHTGMNKFIPLKPCKFSSQPRWFNATVNTAIRKKRRLWEIYRASNSPADLNSYNQANKATKKAILNAKKNYEKRLANDGDCRPFHQYLKSKTKSRTGVGPLISNGSSTSDSTEMAGILNNFFSSVFVKEDKTNIPSPVAKPVPNTLDVVIFTDKSVKEAIKKLKPNSAPGPDGLTSRLFIEARDQICIPLAILFNKSLMYGTVPEDWRIANVTPIFKKGKKGLANNYRPISLTSIACKIME